MRSPVRHPIKIRGLAAGCLVLVGAAIATVPAHAGLGARAASVDSDRVRLSARLKATAHTNYTVSELTGADGTVTREYTSASGTVFAVSWKGATRPDLQTLFGDYFPRFQAENHHSGRVHMRGALRADDIDFVVRTGGHSGAMWGYAMLPDQVPQGFSLEMGQ